MEYMLHFYINPLPLYTLNETQLLNRLLNSMHFLQCQPGTITTQDIKDSSFQSRRRGRSARLGLNKGAPSRGTLVTWRSSRADGGGLCDDDETVAPAGLGGSSYFVVSTIGLKKDLCYAI